MKVETSFVNAYGRRISTKWEVEKIEYNKPIKIIENGEKKIIGYDNYFHLRRPSITGGDLKSGVGQKDCKILKSYREE